MYLEMVFKHNRIEIQIFHYQNSTVLFTPIYFVIQENVIFIVKKIREMVNHIEKNDILFFSERYLDMLN